MKKKTYLIILIILLILLFVSLGVLYIRKKEEENTLVYEINMQQLEEKINNKDTFILVMTQTGCVHCQSYLPTIKKVSREYGVTFYVLNRAKLSKEEYNRLKDIANISGTPVTIFIVDGEEKTALNRLTGSIEKSRLVEKLISEGYINEQITWFL